MDNGYEREFTYVYGAMSPVESQLDWRICHQMNTEQTGHFPAQVSSAHPEDFIGCGVDVASSHEAKELVSSRETSAATDPNPTPHKSEEHRWNAIQVREYADRVFADVSDRVPTLTANYPDSPPIPFDSNALRIGLGQLISS